METYVAIFPMYIVNNSIYFLDKVNLNTGYQSKQNRNNTVQILCVRIAPRAPGMPKVNKS